MCLYLVSNSGSSAVPGLRVSNGGSIGPSVLPHVVEFAIAVTEAVVGVDERSALGEFTTVRTDAVIR